MAQRHAHLLRLVLAFVFAACAAAIIGCAQPGPPAAPRGEAAFEEAITAAIDDLFAQTQQLKLPAFMAKIETTIQSQLMAKRGVLVDPVIEAGSGNQTTATHTIDARIAQRIAERFPNIEVLPFQPGNLAKAQYALAGSMARGGQPGVAGGGYQIDLSLIDLKTRSAVAHASSLARPTGVDTTPTAYYRDSPVLLRDANIEHVTAASRTPAGQPANSDYLKQLPAAALLADATNAYNADRVEQALALYQQALAAPGGDQIRVHNGIYLTNWRLGRMAEAEDAFGRVVASGLASRSLGVKFLFKANSTDFWPDPKVSSAYDFWLRQIARQAATSRACLHVVGHTSRTGSEQYNEQLSQRRAQYIKQRLETESAELAARTKASGVGFRENLVGTGTDDTRDALDRRVEFKVDNC